MAIVRPDKKHRTTFQFGLTRTSSNPFLQRLEASDGVDPTLLEQVDFMPGHM